MLGASDEKLPDGWKRYVIKPLVEEKAAKCHICSNDLLLSEAYLLGNRCIFCAKEIGRMSLLPFLQTAWYDWHIYQILKTWRLETSECPECKGKGKYRASAQEDIPDMTTCPSCNGQGVVSFGRQRLLGYLGSLGVENLSNATLEQKKKFLKEARRCK